MVAQRVHINYEADTYAVLLTLRTVAIWENSKIISRALWIFIGILAVPAAYSGVGFVLGLL